MPSKRVMHNLLMSSLFRDYVASYATERRALPIAVNGSLPYRPPPRPLHRWKCPPAGPENNLCAPVPALSRSHPSVAVWLLNCGLLNKFAFQDSLTYNTPRRGAMGAVRPGAKHDA